MPQQMPQRTLKALTECDSVESAGWLDVVMGLQVQDGQAMTDWWLSLHVKPGVTSSKI